MNNKKKGFGMGTTLIRIILIHEEECSYKVVQCKMKYMHWDQGWHILACKQHILKQKLNVSLNAQFLHSNLNLTLGSM
jgi:hypothetical protein